MDQRRPEVARAAPADAGARLVDPDVHDDLAVGAGPGVDLVLFEAAGLIRPGLAAPLATAPVRERAELVGSPDVRALVELMASSPSRPSAAGPHGRRAGG
ncbi:hypothetical protein [Umezawaea sp.]|uniref:hypothetical protein n=1 Tax=Umezawaea sp. TaxID=1955258 RepID=UPI002ED35C99